jgi:N-acetylmuramoyl-L-alanine amidase
MAQAGFFRMWVSVLAAVLFAGILAATVFTAGVGAQDAPVNLAGKTIVLDPGHGGGDTGAVNGALKEKEQNLDVAYRLKGLLEASGATVYMTRGGDPSGPGVKDPGVDAFADDATLSNNDRYTYANTTGANILVSIHMNASSDRATNYTTTLFGKWRKDKELAYAVFGALSQNPGLGIGSRTPYSYASGVLLKSNMLATIAETVFVTNPDEAARLSDPTGARQQQIAVALEAGIEECLRTH